MYKLAGSNYKKLLADNVTSTCQKAETSTLDQINTKAKAIAHELKVGHEDRKLPREPSFHYTEKS